MMMEKQKARASAKANARSRARDTLSLSSYLRKKAGHGVPTDMRKEEIQADVAAISSYLATKNRERQNK